jgi:hypothetical protein
VTEYDRRLRVVVEDIGDVTWMPDTAARWVVGESCGVPLQLDCAHGRQLPTVSLAQLSWPASRQSTPVSQEASRCTLQPGHAVIADSHEGCPSQEQLTNATFKGPAGNEVAIYERAGW